MGKNDSYFRQLRLVTRVTPPWSIPHLGYSDHISVMLIPAYRPLLKLTKPVQKLITIWPDDATSTLQDCFQCTDWNMFKEAATYNNHTDLQYTETVTSYIKKCIDDVTVTKTITTRANQKPWMTAEVCGLLKTRDEAFRSGDKAALKTARANLSCGIKNAKRWGGDHVTLQRRCRLSLSLCSLCHISYNPVSKI